MHEQDLRGRRQSLQPLEQLGALRLEPRDVRIDAGAGSERVALAVHDDPRHLGLREAQHVIAGAAEGLHRRRVLMVTADHDDRRARRREPLDEEPRLRLGPEVREVAGEQHAVDRRLLAGGQARRQLHPVDVVVDVTGHQQPDDAVAMPDAVLADELAGDDLEPVHVGLQRREAAVGGAQVAHQRQQPRHVARQAVVLDARARVDRDETHAEQQAPGGGGGGRPEDCAAGQRAPATPQSGGDERADGGAEDQQGRELAPQEARERGLGAGLQRGQILDELLSARRGGDPVGQGVVDRHVDGGAVRMQSETAGGTERQHQLAARQRRPQREADRPGRDAVAGGGQQPDGGGDQSHGERGVDRRPQPAPSGARITFLLHSWHNSSVP